MKPYHKNRAGLLAAFAVVFGLAAISQSAQAGISSTKHNLSSTGTQSTHVTNVASDLCGFCHTPHGAATGANTPPLWNKPIGAVTYTIYDSAQSSTIDGKVVGGTSLTGSPSLGCLTCHDGTAAMDVYINAPGSGGYNAAGQDAGYTWAAGSNIAGLGTMTNAAGRINMLGQDLRNDHPISIQYCGGGVTGAAATKAGVNATGTCTDTDFTGPGATALRNGNYNGTQVFWIDRTGGVANTREKNDVILYTSAADGPTVECGSCHDPHTDGTAPNGPTFLRVANTGSALCLMCHVK